MLGEVVDDPPVPQRDRLEQGSVQLVAIGMQGQPQDHPAQAGVGEDRAVAVPPVEGEQPGLPRADCPGRPFELGEPGIARRERLHEPREHVADGHLPGLVPVHARKDPVLDHPGYPRKPDLVGVDNHVADRGADNRHVDPGPLHAAARHGHE